MTSPRTISSALYVAHPDIHDLRPKTMELSDVILTYCLVDRKGAVHTIICNFETNTWGELRQKISEIYSEHVIFALPTRYNYPLMMSVTDITIDSDLLINYSILFPQVSNLIEVWGSK